MRFLMVAVETVRLPVTRTSSTRRPTRPGVGLGRLAGGTTGVPTRGGGGGCCAKEGMAGVAAKAQAKRMRNSLRDAGGKPTPFARRRVQTQAAGSTDTEWKGILS